MILFTGFLPACLVQDNSGNFLLGQQDSCDFPIHPLTGEGIHWDREDFPIPLYVHDSVPPLAHRIFVSVVDQWNMTWEDFLLNEGLEPFDLFVLKSQNQQYSGSPAVDQNNMLFFEEDLSRYNQPLSAQAITTVFPDRQGRIKDADILASRHIVTDYIKTPFFYDESYAEETRLARKRVQENRRLASLQPQNLWFRIGSVMQQWLKFFLKPFQKQKPIRQTASSRLRIPQNRADYVSVMIHELGHVLGLGHKDKEEELAQALSSYGDLQNRVPASRRQRRAGKKVYVSIMEPRLENGTTRRHIYRYDLENLLCGYFGY